MSPKFSIICPSFNHEKYVADFIKSILNQTCQDFELIIVDDCSTDKNVDVIKSFNDPKIKLVQHEYNKGINAALNTAIENSTGQIIAFGATDDIFEPNYLSTINNIFETTDTDAIYINLKVIDENGEFREDYQDSSLPFLESYSREQLLYKAFFKENPLYSPGYAIKKECIKSFYPLPLGNIIFQDYKMNISSLINNKVKILPDKLVRYRIENTRKSICGDNNTFTRCNFEMSSLMDEFLKIDNVDFLKDIFGKEISETSIIPYEDTIKYFLGRMALLTDDIYKQEWGYHKVMEAYTEYPEVLYSKYNFEFKDLICLVNQLKNNNIGKLNKNNKWYEYIFSLKNSNDRKHKILCILGVKIKLKRY